MSEVVQQEPIAQAIDCSLDTSSIEAPSPGKCIPTPATIQKEEKVVAGWNTFPGEDHRLLSPQKRKTCVIGAECRWFFPGAW